MLDQIKQIDQNWLLWINQHHADWLDVIMITATNRFFWIWLYLLLAYLLISKWKWKGFWLILTIFGVVILVDFISVQAFKKVFERYRPCHHLDLKHLLYLPLKRCGGMYGFVSSHAANTTALASLLLFLRIPKHFPKVKNILIVTIVVYALLNCYSRMYLGVHYPLDILGGIMLGVSVSFIAAKIIQAIPFFSFTKNKH